MTAPVRADLCEGIQAFLDKRPASFPDRVSTDLPQVSLRLDAPVW